MRAYFTGDDHSGALGASGVVTFYQHDFSGAFEVITGDEGPVVTGWEMVEAHGERLLRFDLPTLIAQRFDLDDDSPHVFLAVVNDEPSGLPYLRRGVAALAGDTFRETGFNDAAIFDVADNFSYTPMLPPDSDGDGHFDHVDNCPQTPNPDQLNQDGDHFGDVCDPEPNNPDLAVLSQ